MTLAEIAAEPPLQIASWLAGLAFVVMLVNGGLKLADRLRGEKPRPPNEELDGRVTRLEADLASLRGELTENWKRHEALVAASAAHIHERLETVRKELDGKLGEQMRAAEEGRTRLHHRMDPVVENTAAIAGQLTAFTKSFEQFTQLVVALATTEKS